MRGSCWGMREDYLVSGMKVQTIQKRKKNRARLLERTISKTKGKKMAKTAPKTSIQSEAMLWKHKATCLE